MSEIAATDAGAERLSTLQLLSQLGLADERTLQLAQLFERPQPPPGPSAAELDELEAEIERLRELNRSLVEHSDALAAAIGACRECWGENLACPICAGDGAPGRFLPRREPFERFVRPVIREMGARIARNRQRRAHAAPSVELGTEKES